MWLFRHVNVMSYKCFVMCTELAPLIWPDCLVFFFFSFLSLLSVRKQVRWGLVFHRLLDHIVWSTLPYHIHWKRKIHQIRIDINLFPLIKTYIKTILFNFLIFKKVEFTFVSHSGNFGTLGWIDPFCQSV